MTRFLVVAAFAARIVCAQTVLQIGVEERARWEGVWDRNFTEGQTDGYFLNRFRINLTVKPASWIKFVLQGQDSRVYFNQLIPDAAPYFNPLDLRLGYVELGDVERRPISLRAGRQELTFGDQRLIGASPWSNVARTFDAVRVTLRHDGYRLDVFASSVVNPSPSAFDKPQAGNNLHGLYGGIEKLVPGAVIEPYLLWRIAPNLDSKTTGVRWVGKAPRGIDYGVEIAAQTGRSADDRVRAWAGHWVTGYTLPVSSWKPRLSVEYNYATGDHDPHDGRAGTFDQLYATGHDKMGVTDQVGWRNIRNLRVGFDAKPVAKLTCWVNYHNWWLADAHDALYSATGSVAVAAAATTGSGLHAGQELDAQGSYAWSKHAQAGVGMGHIFPGEFLRRATPGRSYTYPYASLLFTF